MLGLKLIKEREYIKLKVGTDDIERELNKQKKELKTLRTKITKLLNYVNETRMSKQYKEEINYRLKNE